MKKLLIALLLTATNVLACEGDIKGTVTWVSDGDTITVKTATNPKLQVRLAEIDAPEVSHYGSLAQPYGNEARTLLTKMVLNRVVTITPRSIDNYGRTVGKVFYKSTDVNKYMVSNGAAWAYAGFLIDLTIADLETEARNAGLGLWVLPNPIAPWVWRKNNP